jgi:hypothetical protein
MKPKLLLCLALVLSGGLFGCSRTPIHQAASSPDAVFRVVVQPEKTQVHVGKYFGVALKVVNLTTTNQYVHTGSQDWQLDWKVSNPNISLNYGPLPTANIPITIKIPPGGAYTNEVGLMVLRPDSNDKVFFRMGFTPRDTKKTYWSKEITIKVIP